METRYESFLTDNGVAKSRAPDLDRAMRELFSAYCQLDLWQRENFNNIVGERTIREALIQYAETEPGNNTNL